LKREYLVILLIILNLVFTPIATSGDFGRIEGRVVDKQTKEPLPGVSVVIKKTTMGAATDKDGKYSITKLSSGDYRIVAMIIGYATVSKKAKVASGNTTVLDFQLCPDPVRLSGIEVTSRREVASLATSVREITQEDIKTQASLTVADVLKASPSGIDVTMRCPYEGTGVYIRGFRQHQTKILIDGVPVYEPFRKSFDLSMIPTGSIAKIKLIKGPSSVLYGANTMGGVVNIITKKRRGKPLTEVSCSFGRDKTMKYQIDHGAGFGKLNYWVSGNYGSSEGFRLSKSYDSDPEVSPFEDGGLRENSDYIRRSLALRVGFAPNEEEGIDLSFMVNDNEAGLPIPPNPTKLTEGPNSYNWRFKDKDRWQVGLVSVIKPKDWMDVKTCGFYAHTVLTLDSYSDSTFTRLSYRNSSKSHLTGGFVHACLRHGRIGVSKLGFGYQWDQNRRQDSRTEGTAIYELATITFGFEEESRINNRLSSVVGVSYDILDPLKVAEATPGPRHATLNPQGGVVLRLSDKLELHASVGKKTSFPAMRDLYWRKEEGGCWVGNPDLLPEVTWTYELGIEHEVGDRLTSNLVLFRNDVRNLITTVALFDQGQYWRRENVEKALMQGAEVSIRFYPTPDFSATVNYTYLETENRTSGSMKGEELLYRPKHHTTLDLRHAFDFGVNLSLQVSGSSEKRYYWAPSDVCVYQIPPEERPQGEIPGYLVCDGKLSRDFNQHLKVSLSVKNIFDVDYVDRGSPKMGYEPMPGRTILVGLKVRP
jgi:outer membrane receptor for ferrienterochelin and colicins